MKLGYKLSAVFLAFTIFATLLFYIIGLQYQRTSFRLIAVDDIHTIKDLFFNLQERDTKILFSTLEVLVQDPGIRKVYQKGDREKLYTYVHPLFERLRDRYDITHFYFILPDSRVFLRVHDKRIFGDPVNRLSFRRARDTKNPAWELEVGKTAFALRTVMPYYNEGKLIGYLELGEEIDHFLKILKDQSHSEFAMISDKENLDRENWKSVRQIAGLRDNWDDMKNHVVLGSTGADNKTAKCFLENKLSLVEKGENILGDIQVGEQTFMCCGFNLNDARGQHIGAVLSLLDITGHVAFANRANNTLLHAAIFLFLATFIAGVLVSRSITRPISKLQYAAEQIGKGNMTVEIDVHSKDEIKELADSFRKMASDLQNRAVALNRAYKDMESFSYAISHDLKAPLRRIDGFSEILSRDYAAKLDDYGKDLLTRIAGNTQKMTRLIEDILAFSRFGSGNIDKLAIDMKALAASVYEEIKSIVSEREITFEIKTMPLAYGDPLLIHQVLFNLLSNAIKFTRTRMPAIIRIGGYTDKGEHVYYVQDNGIGFDMQFADKLFGLFQRIHVEKEFEGTGVGLVIVKKIIEKHGGRVWAKGKPGEGATFFFSLPGKRG